MLPINIEQYLVLRFCCRYFLYFVFAIIITMCHNHDHISNNYITLISMCKAVDTSLKGNLDGISFCQQNADVPLTEVVV